MAHLGAMAEYTRCSYTQEKYQEPTNGHFPDATHDRQFSNRLNHSLMTMSVTLTWMKEQEQRGLAIMYSMYRILLHVINLFIGRL